MKTSVWMPTTGPIIGTIADHGGSHDQMCGALDLTGAVLVTAPFGYATLPACLRRSVADSLLDWFESDAPWRLVEADFYDQWEFSLWDVEAPEAKALTSNETLSRLRAGMGRLFGCDFSEKVAVAAHRLSGGQRIAIHNDYLAGEETHRLVVQLNRGLTDEQGGFLMLFNSADARDVHQVLRPAHRSGLAFEISASSFHAVSRVHGGERYTIVFSFYAKSR